jgi:hypothetical protein
MRASLRRALPTPRAAFYATMVQATARQCHVAVTKLPDAHNATNQDVACVRAVFYNGRPAYPSTPFMLPSEYSFILAQIVS